MDLKDLNLDKASIEKLLEGVVEVAVDELYKAEPNNAEPGLANDFAESDAVAAAEGVATKAEDSDDDDDEDEDEDGKKKKQASSYLDSRKSDTSSPDLNKSIMKSVVGMQKAITGLSEQVASLSKGAARGPKAVIKENEVEIIEKGAVNEDEGNLDNMIKAQPRLVGAALAKMHSEGKITGQYLTEFELFGVNKLTPTIKKAALAEANLIK